MSFKIIIFLFLFFLSQDVNAQIKTYELNDNKSSVVDSIISLPDEKFIFFCPTFNFICEKYQSSISDLEATIKKSGISDCCIFVICYKEVPENASKGIILTNQSENHYISNLGVYYSYAESERIKRASKILSKDYNFNQVFEGQNLYQVELIEQACYQFLYDHIPAYNTFIIETLIPNYSDKERIQHLTDSLGFANKKIENIGLELINLKNQNDSLISRLDRIEYFVDSFHRESIQSLEGDEYIKFSGDYTPSVIEPKRRPKDAIMTVGAILMSFLTMSFIIFS